jgi:hypothetical protein
MKTVRKQMKATSSPLAQLEATLVEIAMEAGYRVIPVPAEAMAIAKGKSRLQDARRIASGKSTAEQIQKKNDRFPGNIVVLDWSPAFA